MEVTRPRASEKCQGIVSSKCIRTVELARLPAHSGMGFVNTRVARRAVSSTRMDPDRTGVLARLHSRASDDGFRARVRVRVRVSYP